MELEEMEEERRLAYVGITRAKYKLYLSWAKQRIIWGNTGMQTRSRFIDEIDPKLIEYRYARQSENSVSRSTWDSEYQNNKRDDRKDLWREHPPTRWGALEGHGGTYKTKKTGIKIDALSDSTLDDFLSGNMSVEELLNR
jgi:hypothetical protein